MVTGNPIADYNRYEDYREEKMEQLPVCDHCHENIIEEYLYDIDGEIYCEDCAKDIVKEKFRKRTEDYIEVL